MKLILIGMPGSGKSTQGNLLSKELNIPYLSTGDIFRTLSKEPTPTGRYIKEIIDKGSLIPDDKTIQIVTEYLSRSDYKDGYILDGFPRTSIQAMNFKDNIDYVLYLSIDDVESLNRLLKRQDKLRQDDTVNTIKKRIEIFHKQTQPVLDFYKPKGLLQIVDGSKSIEGIHQVIIDILKNIHEI
ncbi:hypothetical protein A3C23_05430 [Candidatus Roizmanbacteria bacterium RIFCSPHIGHO2_02_FULL_37_13b]|uniref:Adenylate kinase n=1 Tax=Candidatus Roizmanbacteria bacterium RIFCSPLOWO2_02_FULL_36_11 TaxID=1802071 RepID=A0A1F7JCK6_9BACT|nr:MAG: hypothetical protein A3C23_05430 [Candidatus Roizmanbacteria bacterium RIFCSPHIGHO2_02_FULL_37_13b]OGK53315.1 MAG: hypothetical protein A3H78_03360 [Candidatus Roizmanbacteria bacterium RIFCSPLOWO2_02_FULL_36_11]